MRYTAYRISPLGVVTVCGASRLDWPRRDMERLWGDCSAVGTSSTGLVGLLVISMEGAAIDCEVSGMVLLDGESAGPTGGDSRGIEDRNLVTRYLWTTYRSPFTSIVIVFL